MITQDTNFSLDSLRYALQRATGIPQQDIQDILDFNWNEPNVTSTTENQQKLNGLLDYFGFDELSDSPYIDRKLGSGVADLKSSLAVHELLERIDRNLGSGIDVRRRVSRLLRRGEPVLFALANGEFVLQSHGELLNQDDSIPLQDETVVGFWESTETTGCAITPVRIRVDIRDAEKNLHCTERTDWISKRAKSILLYGYNTSELNHGYYLDEHGSLEIQVSVFNKPNQNKNTTPVIVKSETAKCVCKLETQEKRRYKEMDELPYRTGAMEIVADTKCFLDSLDIPYEIVNGDRPAILVRGAVFIDPVCSAVRTKVAVRRRGDNRKQIRGYGNSTILEFLSLKDVPFNRPPGYLDHRPRVMPGF